MADNYDLVVIGGGSGGYVAQNSCWLALKNI
jgi:pyruvate/2-oxoglutarate dehydrogenase complex dihydrolipoamide dehydrogenase (E3) component